MKSPDKDFRPSESGIESIVKTAIHENLLDDSNPFAFFFDLDCFSNHLTALRAAFPPPALNTLAVKANPAGAILKIGADFGLGAECASSAEILLARHIGIDPARILFDSPVKTETELRSVLSEGIGLNADNRLEIEWIDAWLMQSEPRGYIGIRINPEVGEGIFRQTSTAVKGSKFGIPIDELRKLIACFPSMKRWLSGIHVHAGSQGIGSENLVRAVDAAVSLAMEFNRTEGFRIDTIDIGGGLPVRYKETDDTLSFQEYADLLYGRCPDLKEFKVMTEFGRSLFARPGWGISRIENVKHYTGKTIVMIHTGAEAFLRSAYMDWHHDLLVLDSNGRLKQDNPIVQDVAGPLCFSGDYICRDRLLPATDRGDFLVIRDAGAYTFSMWSFYNLRSFPPIFGYFRDGTLRKLKKAVSSEEIARFWEK